MSDKQVTSGRKTRSQALNNFRLSPVAEINHHVPAENGVKCSHAGQRLNEIDPAKFHHRHHFRLHPVPAFPAALTPQEMLLKPRSYHALEPFRTVRACSSSLQSIRRYVRGKNERYTLSGRCKIFPPDERDRIGLFPG